MTRIQNQELTEIMSHPRILCLGELLVDCLRDAADAGGAEVWTHQPGGAPANVACALARLGTPAGFIGAIGADAAGVTLRETLVSRGVETTMLTTVDAPTRHVFVERDTGGDRRFVGFGTGDRADRADRPGATAQFADMQLDAATFKAAPIVRADWLVTGTLGLAQPQTARAIERAVGMAKQSMTSVFVDVNWRSVFWQDFAGVDRLGEPETPRDRILRFLSKADWLKFSDDDARYLLDTDDVGAIAARFPGARGVVVTRGDRGCAYRVGAIAGECAAFPTQAIDTTGAGDSFVAALLHRWCAAVDAIDTDTTDIETDPDALHAAIEFASMAGALTTQKLGAIAAQPTAAAVRDALAARSPQ